MMTLAERIEEKGKLEGKLEIAKLMLAEKQPLDFIMKFTNLTLEQIKGLSNQDGHLVCDFEKPRFCSKFV